MTGFIREPLERSGPKLEALPRRLRSVTLNEVLVCVRGMELDDLARAPVVTAECAGHERFSGPGWPVEDDLALVTQEAIDFQKALTIENQSVR